MTRVKSTHERRIAAGLCKDCENPPITGKRCCQPCADKRNAEARDKRRRFAATDFCTCGELSTGGSNYCATCSDRNLAGAQRRLDRLEVAGLCRHCGRNERDNNMQTCGGCRVKLNEKVKKYHLRINYGMTTADKDRLLAEQGGRYANNACGFVFVEGNTATSPCIDHDHDHATGRVRWLLCVNCNFALGHTHDSGLILRGLADYADRHAAVAR